MDLRQLHHALTIYRCKSFTRAAEEHGLTQQALSRSLAKLEAELGVRLFERNGRTVRPTLFGDLLIRHGGTIDAELTAFRRTLDTLLGRGTDRLAVGTGPGAAGDTVTRAIMATTQRRPRLRVSVRADRLDLLIAELLRGDLDLIFTVGDGETIDHMLERETVGREQHLLVAGPDHPLAGPRTIGLVETLDHPWLAYLPAGPVTRAVAAAFARLGKPEPEPTVRTDSLVFARRALAESRMLAVLPRHAVARDLETGGLAALSVAGMDDWWGPLAVIWRRGSTRSPDALALIAQLRGTERRAAKPPGQAVAGQAPSA